ncbi:MAG: DUF929 family protein [Acidimicrobiales bacterium]
MSLDAAPAQAPAPVTGRTIPRRYLALGLIVVAILLVIALIAVRDDDAQNGTSTVETFTPAPVSIIAPLTHVPTTTADAVGATATGIPLTPLRATGSPALWEVPGGGGAAKPVVFFYGAEFAPYAAAERWPVIVALSRFGTIWPVGLMQSSDSVAFAGTSTFTFWHTRYASPFIDLQAVERYSALNPTGNGYTTLETPTSRQAAAVAVYDAPDTTFPLLDVANRYVLTGSSFSPSVLAGLSQAQIVSDLAIPTSPVTEAIVASANEISAAICTVTNDRPASVCHARGVLAAGAKLRGSGPTG